MINKKCYLKFWKALKKNDNYLITTHINPDADGICSIIVFGIILKSMKKKYYILIEDDFPEKLKFLFNEYTKYLVPELINIPKGKDLKVQLPESFKPETVLILDTCGNDRLGEFSRYFSEIKTILNIDHHAGKRNFPGKVDLVDIKSGATGEIIYNLLRANKYKIKTDIAKLLYISIITDTRNFTQSNATYQTHSITSELLKTGISPDKISFHFEELPVETLKIYGKVISRLKLNFKNKLAYSYITKNELKKCLNADTDGLIEILRNTKNTQCTILFKEIDKNKVKVSLRGKAGFDVYKIANNFNGGGHKEAAGFNINKKLNLAIKLLLNKLKKYFK